MLDARKRARDPDWERKLAWGLGIVVTGTGIYLGRQAYLGWKAKQEIIEHEEFVVEGANLQQIATEINDAFYGYFYGEDEKAAMDSLKSAPPGTIQQVAVLYNGINGQNLYTDFRKYLSNDQYNQIKHLLQ